MTSPTPQDPWLLPVAPHPDQAGGKRRVRPLPVVLVSLLALAVLCCGGATLVTVFGPGKAKPVDATASAPARQQIAALPTTSNPVAATSPPVATSPVAVKSSPTRSATVKPSRTTTEPTTPARTSKPPAPKPKPTTPKPAPTKTALPPVKIVHAGAFFTPAGATGVTSSGKAMVCRSTATDSRNRWRAAVLT